MPINGKFYSLNDAQLVSPLISVCLLIADVRKNELAVREEFPYLTDIEVSDLAWGTTIVNAARDVLRQRSYGSGPAALALFRELGLVDENGNLTSDDVREEL
jgi:hypothetical protein